MKGRPTVISPRPTMTIGCRARVEPKRVATSRTAESELRLSERPAIFVASRLASLCIWPWLPFGLLEAECDHIALRVFEQRVAGNPAINYFDGAHAFLNRWREDIEDEVDCFLVACIGSDRSFDGEDGVSLLKLFGLCCEREGMPTCCLGVVGVKTTFPAHLGGLKSGSGELQRCQGGESCDHGVALSVVNSRHHGMSGCR